jgi:hypothetical protein
MSLSPAGKELIICQNCGTEAEMNDTDPTRGERVQQVNAAATDTDDDDDDDDNDNDKAVRDALIAELNAGAAPPPKPTKLYFWVGVVSTAAFTWCVYACMMYIRAGYDKTTWGFGALFSGIAALVCLAMALFNYSAVKS